MINYMHIPRQLGADPDQILLEEQLRIDEPESLYPLLQEYVAVPPGK